MKCIIKFLRNEAPVCDSQFLDLATAEIPHPYLLGSSMAPPRNWNWDGSTVWIAMDSHKNMTETQATSIYFNRFQVVEICALFRGFSPSPRIRHATTKFKMKVQPSSQCEAEYAPSGTKTSRTEKGDQKISIRPQCF